jgi:Ras-related GTP-binding protein C/D
VHTYELCADLVDVVIDVSYIYGLKNMDPSVRTSNGTNDVDTDELELAQHHANASSSSPYDEASTSAIKLNNGMVLYLRQVSDLLALVCLIREENFAKRSLLDYNIDCLKDTLKNVLAITWEKGTNVK